MRQYVTSACQILKQACCKESWKIRGCIAKENTNLHHNNPQFLTVSKGFEIELYFLFLFQLKKTVPIMPCSSPKHAPLHFRGQLLGPYVWLAKNHSGSAGLKWKAKKARVIKRKKMDMQQNKLLLWSERGIWLWLSHVHLPRRHLIGSGESDWLPKNWWGFEGCPIRVVARHTLSGSKYDVRGETPGGSSCLYVLDVC